MSKPSNAQEIFFIIEGETIRTTKQSLIHKPYFQEILSGSENYPEIRILLPDWMSSHSFNLYLSYVETSKIPRVDSLSAQKLLWSADFFQDHQLQNALIVESILPNLTKDTVLLFLQDAFTKISSSNSESWIELYKNCLLFAAKNSHYIFSRFQNILETMEPKLIEEIIKYSMGESLKMTNAENSFIIEKIRALNNATGFINLLEIEEKKITENFDCVNPCFEWEISDFNSGNFYKESEKFLIEGTEWILCIWSFEHESKVEISIKHANSSTETTFAKDSIVTLSLLLQLESEHIHPQPQLVALLIGSKSQSTIRSISPFNPQETSSLSLKLYGKIEYLYSALLQHLAKNPEISLEVEDIKSLPRDKLEAILSYKYLNVNSEDQALNLAGRWCEQYPYHLVDEDISQLLSCIKWEYITLRGLLKSVKLFPALKRSKAFQDTFRREIETKSKSKRSINRNFYLESSEKPPRRSYKKAEKEQFESLKDYITSLSDVILEQDGLGSTDKDITIQHLSNQLRTKEQEIKELKQKMAPSKTARSQAAFSPTEDETSFATPVSKLRVHTSTDSLSNSSIDGLFKPRRSGEVLNSLMAKLQSKSPRSK